MTEIVQECAICLRQLTHVFPGDAGSRNVSCPRCGNYTVTDSALPRLATIDTETRRRLSSNVYYRNKLGQAPTVTSYFTETMSAVRVPGVQARADILLTELARALPNLGASLPRKQESLVAATWSLDGEEVGFLEEYLKSQGLIDFGNLNDLLVVTPKGHLVVEGFDVNRGRSEQIFVAMWFSNEMFETYDSHISKAIMAAGYRPHIVSNREHNGKIDDEIISEIRKSRAVLADFTGHRGGVYFESGFAMGLGIPLFWTCKAAELDSLHFDIRQYNFITWQNGEDLVAPLTRRLVSILGEGPLQR